MERTSATFQISTEVEFDVSQYKLTVQNQIKQLFSYVQTGPGICQKRTLKLEKQKVASDLLRNLSANTTASSVQLLKDVVKAYEAATELQSAQGVGQSGQMDFATGKLGQILQDLRIAAGDANFNLDLEAWANHESITLAYGTPYG